MVICNNAFDRTSRDNNVQDTNVKMTFNQQDGFATSGDSP